MSHYFVERAISVAIYTLVAFAFCNHLVKKDANISRTFFLLTLVLSTLAYFVQPAPTMDLYRLWITADEYNRYSTLKMITEIFSGWSSPLGLVYVCLVSKFNYHLLPAITVYLFYSNIFYIIKDYWKKHEISRSSMALVLLFFLSRGVYGELISGIRSMLAFSFVARCMYDEIYNKKSVVWNIPIYTMAALFHSSSMGAIAIWFVLKIVFDQKGWKKIISLLMCVVFAAVFYSKWGIIVTRNLNVGLERLIEGDSYSYVWEFAFNTLYMLISLNLLWVTIRGLILSDEGIRMRRLTTIFYCVTIICISSYSIYHRFISFVSMFSLPVMVESINTCEVEEREISVRNLLVLSIIMMGLSCIKGNLNGIKFFIL